MNVYTHLYLDKETKAYMLSKLPADVTWYEGATYEQMEDRFSKFVNCDVAFGNVPPEWLQHNDQLKWLQLESVGYEAYASLLMTQGTPMLISNLQGFFGVRVAETALAGILSLKRGLLQLIEYKGKKQWVGSAIRSELATLTRNNVLIVGKGNIGQSLAHMLQGFDVDVNFHTRTPEVGDSHTIEELEARIPLADVVVCCLPERTDTVNLFDRNRLALLRPDALFVNVGRGRVLDEQALADLLMEGKIGGAVLDVSIEEPLPPNHRFWDCPNLILSQHSGGGSTDELVGKVDFFLRNLTHYRKNEPLIGQLNLTYGMQNN